MVWRKPFCPIFGCRYLGYFEHSYPCWKSLPPILAILETYLYLGLSSLLMLLRLPSAGVGLHPEIKAGALQHASFVPYTQARIRQCYLPRIQVHICARVTTIIQGSTHVGSASVLPPLAISLPAYLLLLELQLQISAELGAIGAPSPRALEHESFSKGNCGSRGS